MNLLKKKKSEIFNKTIQKSGFGMRFFELVLDYFQYKKKKMF